MFHRETYSRGTSKTINQKAMLTVNELLSPRFKVIADYPNSIYVVNQIMQQNGQEFFNTAFFQKYPNIFKELAWFEERTYDELVGVKYVKRIGKFETGVVLTVADPKYNFREWHINNEIEFRFIKDSGLIPVTENEYNDYIKTKKHGNRN